MRIASELCIFTNDRVTLEEIDLNAEEEPEPDRKAKGKR
jgi:hypothetical protein